MKKIPQSGKENDNAIDKIIQQKNSNHDCLHSEQNTRDQTGYDINSASKEKLVEFNNVELQKKDSNDNQHDVQYYEREISVEEELKLRTALTNHFLFQDLNEDIM